MFKKSYLRIVAHYEAALAKHGDTHLGVRWPDANDAETRHLIMLGLLQPPLTERVSLLDFGCGTSHLLDLMVRLGIDHIDYHGLDISPAYIEISSQKYPHVRYYCLDILEPDATLPQFDYVIMNGVFTIRLDLSFEEMFAFFRSMLKKVFTFTRRGVAVNLMSPYVHNWEDTLFYVDFDPLVTFITADLSPHFTIRNDYALPDYTVYIYR